MIILLILVMAAACAWIAYGKGRNAGLWFAIGVAFSLVALIIIACLPPVEAKLATTKACPDCAETVPVAARLCRFCRHEFAESEAIIPATAKPTVWQTLFWNPRAGE